LIQKAGFADDRIVESHGTIHYLQCVQPDANSTIWPIEHGTTFDVDDDLRLRGPTPRGPPSTNNYDTRPNILMFGDWSWLSQRTDEQEQRFDSFCRDNLHSGLPFVVIEVGAGEIHSGLPFVVIEDGAGEIHCMIPPKFCEANVLWLEALVDDNPTYS